MSDRPTCRLCGLEDGACICAHIPTPAQPSNISNSGAPTASRGADATNATQPVGSPNLAQQTPVAWQFRQRSGVGPGPQSQAPWCDWCGIEREDYERYLREPNKLIEVRALYALASTNSPEEAGK